MLDVNSTVTSHASDICTVTVVQGDWVWVWGGGELRWGAGCDVYLQLMLPVLSSLLGPLQGPEGLAPVGCQLPQLGSSLLLQAIHAALQLLLS